MSEKRFVRSVVYLVAVLGLCLLTPGVRGANILFISSMDPVHMPGDDALKAFMEGLGHTVTYFDDNENEANTEAAAKAADLVFVSESVGSANIRTEITEIETPMIVTESWGWDEMGLTLGAGAGQDVVSTDIEVVEPGHYLAAGFSGKVTVLKDIVSARGAARFSNGIAGQEAAVIARATLLDGQTYDVFYIYEKGAKLPIAPADGSPAVAADMRICLGFDEQSYLVWNENAYAFLEASVRYALGMTPQARNPNPHDGALHTETWANLTWVAGDTAVSHDVYFGETFDDVNNGTGGTFRGNQAATSYVVGFPGYPYPDGLVPGTTYYWRIDEIEADGVTKHKGYVWSFTIPPKKAYNPNPVDGAESVDPAVTLNWTAGFGAKLHTVYFGDNFDNVSNAVTGIARGTTTYTPGPLKFAKTYYWCVDEFDGTATYKGDVWSFTTLGAVGNPKPADGAVDVKQTPVLSWTAGAYAASHEVYLGTNADAVRNATKASPEFKATKALGDESYAPAKLAWETTYFWRIDEVNNVNPDSPWVGKVWSFTTADFAIVDDFESYDAGENQIWYSWHDGLGYGTPQSPPYFAGNGTGAAVGDETTASYTEQTIVHGGSQSMPLSYDNNKQGFAKYSEAELTLIAVRDWTEGSVAQLSLWFQGRPLTVGGFTEAPAGTYTIAAAGADIWGTADQFHFGFKTLAGIGTIEAKVLSVDNTDPWAKGGVMIRETLDAGSKFAAVYITPGNGCRFQARTDTGIAATSDTSVATAEQIAIKAPYWVKLERDAAGNFRGYYSSNGVTWQPMVWRQGITMSSDVYVGLAVTSHNNAATCQAKFSNVKLTGTVGAQWAHQDIGIFSNAAERLYVAISNSAGAPAVVYHDDPVATTITTWTEWVVPLQKFADQGVNLKNVDKIALGLGTRGNMTAPGEAGKVYFDDIQLHRPAGAP
jgi:hypothetical protein